MQKLNTRSLILSLAFTPAILSQSALADNPAQQSRPNILWITIEDTSPQFIGCYGNSNARTPVIDKLAQDGVRFTNAFSTGTVCSPSRTAIITGVKTYKAGTGNHRSKYPVPDHIKGFPHYLQKAGYYTTNNAKTDYNVANEKQFIGEAWNESSGKAGWWNRQPGQPFFAVFNYNESHQSRTMTETYEWYLDNVLHQLAPEERIGDDEFDMPPIYLDSPEMRKQFARVYNSIKLTDNKIGELLARLEVGNLRDSTIIFFYADHGEGMPRGKTNGIDYGYRVPFIIWFPEMYKHLSPWGTAGIITRQLVDFTDLAPTLLSLVGADIPEHLEGRPLMGDKRKKPADYLVLSSDRSDNGIDMVRTVTDGRYIYSRNFLPFIPEARYIRYMEIGEIKQQMRMDLAENRLNPLQKSLFESRPPEFLFDIENDPWETRNLATDREYANMALLYRMRYIMKEEILRSRDVMLLPEYEIALLSEKTTPYEFRLSKKEYPVKKIYKAARRSGFRGEIFGKYYSKKQAGWLSHKDKIIRYWAIVGLRSQDPENLVPHAEKIISAMNDPYPPVAVTASAIAYEYFNDKTSEELLKKFIASENPHISLMAIYYLMYSEKRELFAETVKEVHATTGGGYNVKAACMDFLGSLNLVPNNPDYRE